MGCLPNDFREKPFTDVLPARHGCSLFYVYPSTVKNIRQAFATRAGAIFYEKLEMGFAVPAVLAKGLQVALELVHAKSEISDKTSNTN